MEIEATRVTGFTGSKNGKLDPNLGGEDRLYNYIDPKSRTVNEGSLNCIADQEGEDHICNNWNDRSNEDGSDAFRFNLEETEMTRTFASVAIERSSRTKAIINRQITRVLGKQQKGYVGVRFEPKYENKKYKETMMA